MGPHFGTGSEKPIKPRNKTICSKIISIVLPPFKNHSHESCSKISQSISGAFETGIGSKIEEAVGFLNDFMTAISEEDFLFFLLFKIKGKDV